jgi:hypothetical protein
MNFVINILASNSAETRWGIAVSCVRKELIETNTTQKLLIRFLRFKNSYQIKYGLVKYGTNFVAIPSTRCKLPLIRGYINLTVVNSFIIQNCSSASLTFMSSCLDLIFGRNLFCMFSWLSLSRNGYLLIFGFIFLI